MISTTVMYVFTQLGFTVFSKKLDDIRSRDDAELADEVASLSTSDVQSLASNTLTNPTRNFHKKPRFTADVESYIKNLNDLTMSVDLIEKHDENLFTGQHAMKKFFKSGLKEAIETATNQMITNEMSLSKAYSIADKVFGQLIQKIEGQHRFNYNVLLEEIKETKQKFKLINEKLMQCTENLERKIKEFKEEYAAQRKRIQERIRTAKSTASKAKTSVKQQEETSPLPSFEQLTLSEYQSMGKSTFDQHAELPSPFPKDSILSSQFESPALSSDFSSSMLSSDFQNVSSPSQESPMMPSYLGNDPSPFTIENKPMFTPSSTLMSSPDFTQTGAKKKSSGSKKKSKKKKSSTTQELSHQSVEPTFSLTLGREQLMSYNDASSNIHELD